MKNCINCKNMRLNKELRCTEVIDHYIDLDCNITRLSAFSKYANECDKYEYESSKEILFK